jgi:hypothetical protein
MSDHVIQGRINWLNFFKIKLLNGILIDDTEKYPEIIMNKGIWNE